MPVSARSHASAKGHGSDAHSVADSVTEVALARVRNRLRLRRTSANEAIGNMELFNNHSGLRCLPHFIKGLYWATCTTPR